LGGWRLPLTLILLALAVVTGLTACADDEQIQGTASENNSSSAATDNETTPPATEQGRPRESAPVILRGPVTDVVDGDTIKVLSRGFETTVRLLGIDTPETRRPGGFVQCFGPAASARTRRLLPNGQDVRLVTDVSQDQRDRYGRLLAYVYKPGKSDATDSVNHALVATGYAKVYIYRGNPFQHVAAFQEAEARARRRAIGLWGPPCNGDTTKPEPSR
jgi:endonuclease YncB( thermonuclease family)